MDHGYFKDRVSAFYDNELAPQERVIVEEHIRGCEECQKLLADLKRLDEVVAKNCELADSDYWEKSAQKIEKKLGFTEKPEIIKVERKWYAIGRMRAVALAASVVLLVIIGYNADKILRKETITPTLKEVLPIQETPANKPSVNETKPFPEERKENEAVRDEKSGKPISQSQVKQPPSSVSDTSKPEQTDNYAITQKQGEIQKSPSGEGTRVNEPNSAKIDSEKTIDALPTPEKKPEPVNALRSPVVPSGAGDTSKSERVDNLLGKLKEKIVTTIPPKQPLQTMKAPADLKKDTIDSLGAGVSDSLESWRLLKDSLIAKQNELTSTLPKYGIAPLTNQKTEQPSKQSELDSVEKRLITVWYNIARLSPDLNERIEAKDKLRAVAINMKSSNCLEAIELLHKLKD